MTLKTLVLMEIKVIYSFSLEMIGMILERDPVKTICKSIIREKNHNINVYHCLLFFVTVL